MRKILGIGAAVAISVGTLIATVPAANAAPCGYFTANSSGGDLWAYYNHCDSRTTVMIHVDNVWPRADYDTCVGPGVTPLRYPAAHTNGAWYTGGVGCRP